MKRRYETLATALLLHIAIPGVAVAQDGQPNSLRSLVQESTRQYRDHTYAIAMGYQPLPECVSGPDGGAMGVHFVHADFLFDELPPDVNQPEALLYEPMPGGGYRLVGVEYITFEGPATAWKENPNGTFADWNPNVSCDAFVPPPA